MKNKALSILLLLAISQLALAYPIQPRPLRRLVIESEYIVYAEVMKVKSAKSAQGWDISLAVLVIQEVLQGNLEEQTIEVAFNPNLICPTPAHYEKGTKVLAFLDRGKEHYVTHALSYGSKTISPSVYQLYKKRIMEMQEILNIKKEEEKINATIDWLLSCAQEEATYWEGMQEFLLGRFFYDYDREKQVLIQKYQLTEKQQQMLRAIILGRKEWFSTELEVLDLVVQQGDTEVVQALIVMLKEADKESLYFKRDLVKQIAKYANREELSNIITAIEAIDYEDKKKEEKMEQLLQQFTATL